MAIGLKNCLLMVEGLKVGKFTFFRRKFYYLLIFLTLYLLLISFHSFSLRIEGGKGQHSHYKSLSIPACLMMAIAVALGCSWRNSNLSTALMVSASMFLRRVGEILEFIFKIDSKGDRQDTKLTGFNLNFNHFNTFSSLSLPLSQSQYFLSSSALRKFSNVRAASMRQVSAYRIFYFYGI